MPEYGRKTAHILDKYVDEVEKKDKKKKDSYVSGVVDFVDNYLKMTNMDLKEGDDFFHCKANYEATKRGPKGEQAAKDMSELREWLDKKFKGDSDEDIASDMRANKRGRDGAKAGKRLKYTCPTFFSDYE